jgi:hypothetical protein
MIEKMSRRLDFVLSRITILFVVSFIGLWLHIVDDAIITNEPAWYGISVAEFLLACALVYMIVPPIGLWLARRGSVIGMVIVLGYAFQALYGAGVNHVRHLFGNFSGSQLLPSILNSMGIDVTDIRGHGPLTVVMGMLGLGITPPHTHILASTILVFINIAVNISLILFTLSAIYFWWQARRVPQPTTSEQATAS